MRGKRPSPLPALFRGPQERETLFLRGRITSGKASRAEEMDRSAGPGAPGVDGDVQRLFGGGGIRFSRKTQQAQDVVPPVLRTALDHHTDGGFRLSDVIHLEYGDVFHGRPRILFVCL